MSRSVIVGVLVSLPVFFALLDGEFLVILVALIGGYVVHTLLTESYRSLSCSKAEELGGYADNWRGMQESNLRPSVS